MKQSKERVLSPIYLDLHKRSVEDPVFPSDGDTVCCRIDGRAISVTSLVLHMSQPSEILESWVSGFDSISKTPTSWEVEGVFTDVSGTHLDYLYDCFMKRKEVNVDLVNTNVYRMQRFKSKGILTTLTPSSLAMDRSFIITGTAELIETME